MIPKQIKLLTLEEINERFDVDYIRRLIEYVDEVKPNKLINTHYNHGLLNELSIYDGSISNRKSTNDIINQHLNDINNNVTERLVESKKDVVEIPRELYEELMKHIKPNE